MIKGVVWVLLSILLAASALAFVGHDASQITGGTFSTANYAFPQNVSVSGNTLVTGNVGIGTTSPATALQVDKSGAQSIISVGSNAPSETGAVRLYGTGSRYNWQIAAQSNIDNGLEITPSTVVGGTTFSTPIVAITGSGNVGIGTTSPTYQLDVNGGIRAAGQFFSNNGSSETIAQGAGTYLCEAGSCYVGIQMGSNIGKDGYRSLDFWTSSPSWGKRMTILGSGNVGIGTANPGYKLHINSSSNFLIGLDTPSNIQADILFMSAGANKAAIYRPANTNDLRAWGSVSGDIMTFNTTSGNVGIGTTSPAGRLHVTTAGGGTNIRVGTYPAAGSTYSGEVLVLGDNVMANEGAVNGMVNINSHPSYAGSAIWLQGNDGITFHTKSGAAVAGAAYYSPVMKIDSGGNVGIGTTSPGAKLDVLAGTGAAILATGVANQWTTDIHGSNTAGQSYGLVIRAGSNSVDYPLVVTSKPDTGASLFAVRGDGNVGLGIVPTTRLELPQNTAIKVGQAFLSSGGDYVHLSNNEWYDGSGWHATAPGVLIQVSGQQTTFYTHDAVGSHTSRMTIDASGNVGIGVSPSYKLDVEGSATGPVVYASNTGALGSPSAIEGQATYGYGLYGYSSYGWGVYGQSANSMGVRGVGYNVGVSGQATAAGQCNFAASNTLAIDWCSSSSGRWKNNVTEIPNALDMVSKMRGVYFNWDPAHGGGHGIGFIAEEVGKYVPEIVVYEPNGVNATDMDYSKMTPVLLEAIKQLKSQDDAKNTEIDALKAELCKKDPTYSWC